MKTGRLNNKKFYNDYFFLKILNKLFVALRNKTMQKNETNKIMTSFIYCITLKN